MYKLHNDSNGQAIGVFLANTYIPFDPDNTDYQAFLLWKSEGNTPLPAENT